MFSVVREIKFCFGHRLMDYDGKCRRLHGHNARAFFTVACSKVDHRGMALDFAHIKRTMKHWIDEHFDHKTILHIDDPLLAGMRSLDEPVYALDGSPTTENLARELFKQAHQLGVPVTEVALWENDASCAIYNPSGSRSQRIEQDDAEGSAADAGDGGQTSTSVGCEPRSMFGPRDGTVPTGQAGGFTVVREVKFCFGHRLMNYPGKCRQVHGHNGRLLVTVAANLLDDLGMAVDFGQVKAGVEQWIDTEWDHSMILRHGDPLIPLLDRLDIPVVILNENPTTENLAKIVCGRASAAGLDVLATQLWETDSCSAGYAPRRSNDR